MTSKVAETSNDSNLARSITYIQVFNATFESILAQLLQATQGNKMQREGF